MQFEEAILSNQNFLTLQTSQMLEDCNEWCRPSLSLCGSYPPEGGEATALAKGLWCKHCQQVPPRHTAEKGQNVIRPAAWYWMDLYEHQVGRKSLCPQLWRESSPGVAKSRSIPWIGMSLTCLRHWCRLAWRTHSIPMYNRLQTNY